MVENRIVVGKFPGSTTEINQPADQNPFKACKTTLKFINNKDITPKKRVKGLLVKMINAHQETCSTIIDPTHRKYTIQGLLRVETALHEY
jgi:hypothetical protein